MNVGPTARVNVGPAARAVQGINRGTANELRQQPSQRDGPIKEIEADDLPVDEEQCAALPVHRPQRLDTAFRKVRMSGRRSPPWPPWASPRRGREDISELSAHTSPWSDMWPRFICIDRDTGDIRFARPAACCVRGAEVNARDRTRHRPTSTHDTGMVSSDSAGTRIVRFTTRFCFAAEELLAIEHEDRLGAPVDDA
ncbi:MAG: hypothetical protein ABIS06_16550 [Vicinamibacterales bacterium]